MSLPEPQFQPGQQVIAMGSIGAVIDRVMYLRNAVRPVYRIEWWHEGQPQTYEIEEDDLSPTPTNASGGGE
jgi:hypothetical protein